jgi:hypothetical protein
MRVKKKENLAGCKGNHRLAGKIPRQGLVDMTNPPPDSTDLLQMEVHIILETLYFTFFIPNWPCSFTAATNMLKL